jgi:hypothetical protein
MDWRIACEMLTKFQNTHSMMASYERVKQLSLRQQQLKWHDDAFNTRDRGFARLPAMLSCERRVQSPHPTLSRRRDGPCCILGCKRSPCLQWRWTKPGRSVIVEVSYRAKTLNRACVIFPAPAGPCPSPVQTIHLSTSVRTEKAESVCRKWGSVSCQDPLT